MEKPINQRENNNLEKQNENLRPIPLTDKQKRISTRTGSDTQTASTFPRCFFSYSNEEASSAAAAAAATATLAHSFAADTFDFFRERKRVSVCVRRYADRLIAYGRLCAILDPRRAERNLRNTRFLRQ